MALLQPVESISVMLWSHQFCLTRKSEYFFLRAYVQNHFLKFNYVVSQPITDWLSPLPYENPALSCVPFNVTEDYLCPTPFWLWALPMSSALFGNALLILLILSFRFVHTPLLNFHEMISHKSYAQKTDA